MRKPLALDPIERFFEQNAVVSRLELDEAGFDAYRIQLALKAGSIEKLRRGIYCRQDAQLHGLFDVTFACKVCSGVLWGGSAAQFHGLTDDIPYATQVLMGHLSFVKRDTTSVAVEARRTRDELAMTTGIQEVNQDGFRFRVTDPARTVVDLVRWGEVRQHAVEGVRAYLAADGSPADLREMAKAFDAEEEVGGLIDGVMVAFERMPAPGLR